MNYNSFLIPGFGKKQLSELFLVFCHISYLTMDRLKPIIIICIYIVCMLWWAWLEKVEAWW